MKNIFLCFAIVFFEFFLGFQSGNLLSSSVLAQAFQGADKEFENGVVSQLKVRIADDLAKHCLDYCQVLSLDTEVEETFNTNSANLGFEEDSAPTTRTFKANLARAEVLVDSRFGSKNLEKIQKLFSKIVLKYPVPMELVWTPVSYPDTGSAERNEANVRGEFVSKVKNQLDSIVREYCPNDCLVHAVDVDLENASLNEASYGKALRYLFVKDSKGAFYVKGTTAQLSINSALDAERKSRILALMKEQLNPFGEVKLETKEILFPKVQIELQREKDAEAKDPYGLEKLGQALKIFREYANTKEIIRERDTRVSELNSESKTESRNLEKNNEKISSSAKESLQSSESKNSLTESSSKNNELFTKNEGWFSEKNWPWVAGFVLVLVAALAIGLRHVLNSPRAKSVVAEGYAAGLNGSNGLPASSSGSTFGGANVAGLSSFDIASGGIAGGAKIAGSALNSQLQMKLQVQLLKDELIQTFATQPKVARDLFGRILREDGIEFTAKCVVIFGEMVILELVSDADLKQEIYTLSEFVHMNAPVVQLEEQLEILRGLHLKVTAGKMKLMATKTLDVFDFLKGRSPRQIFDLVFSESSRTQAIVLTQIPPDKRRSVFELFEGAEKGELLRELSNSESVQKEYLINVAEALKRKERSSTALSGETVHGIDVLLDLLERADLQAQRDLMANLDITNVESARVVRSRLVSVQTLGLLRDGLLLEVFFGLEMPSLCAFMAGTAENIRSLVLSKAPRDVAENWLEGIQALRSLDVEAYRLSEMQVLSRLRAMAAAGQINILDINSSLYPITRNEFSEDAPNPVKKVFRITNPLVA